MELGHLPYHVRAFYDADLEEVIDLVASEPGRRYQAAEFTRALSPGPAGGHYAYVTIQDVTDRIIGWLNARPEAGDRTRLRLNIVVVPDQRRRGVATAMLQSCLEAARPAGVRELLADALPQQEAAIAFLAAHGFERVSPSDAAESEFARRID